MHSGYPATRAVPSAGYSFGSHLALEIAQQICDLGESVAFLGVIDDSADLGRRHFGIERVPPARLTTMTANRWAFQRYVPKPYPGRITLFRANEPTEVYQSDPFAGWSDLALGGVETHDIAGDHESIVKSDGFHWGSLLAICLAKARHATTSLGRERLKVETAKARRRARALVTNKTTRCVTDARIAAKQGDRKTEIRNYRKAMQADGTQPLWVHRNLAEALIEDGNTSAGLELLERGVAIDPWPIESLVHLATLNLSFNPLAVVEPLYQRGRELAADDPDAMRHWGHLCALAGKVDEAEAATRRAIELEERKLYARHFLGDLHGYLSDLLASQGRLSEAVVEAQEAVRINPKDPKKVSRVAKLRAEVQKVT